MAKKNDTKASVEAVAPAPGSKGAPTRTRKEAEAANRRPLVPNDRKLAKQVDRQKRDEAIAREREALQTGDERYLPYRDKGLVKRYARDAVDARWSLSEFLLPGMLVFLAGTLVVSMVGATSQWANTLMVVLMFVFYGLLFVSLIEATIVWQRIKRRLKVAHPNEQIPKGSWFYVYTRMLMARRWRSPKPQVKRGEFPDAGAPKSKAPKGK